MRSRQDPAEPSRFAAVARASLWGLTVNDPLGNPLAMPSSGTQEEMIRTMEQTHNILTRIEAGRVDGGLYAGAMRDVSLTAKIALSHPNGLYSADEVGHDYYSQMMIALQNPRLD